MPSPRLIASAIAIAAVVACHPRAATEPGAGGDGSGPPPTVDIAPGGIPEPEPYHGVLLGPAESELPALTSAEPEEITFPVDGPRYLYGRAGTKRRRPNAPGRHGDLRIAIDTPYQLFGRSSSYAHVVAWRPDGTPAAGARVYIGRRSIGRTDPSGTLVFQLQLSPATDDDEDFDYGQDSLFVIDGKRRCGAVAFSPYERTKTFATDRLFVYADRGVFQPGETVHVRAIGWRLRHDYSPLHDAEVEFLLRDDKRHTVAAAVGTTDEFGVTSVDLDIPLTAESGNYVLRVGYGEERATTKLQVRHFEPPTLGIEHDLGRFLLATDIAPMELAMTLRLPGGSAVKSAQLRAVARDSDGDLVVSLEREVKGNGPHRFVIDADDVRRLIERSDMGRSASITVEATDAQGRHSEVIQPMVVTNNPFEAVLETDRDEYSTGDPVTIVAKVRDRAGVPLRNTALVLRQDGRETPLRATTDDDGMASFELTMPSASTSVALLRPGQSAELSSTELRWHAPVPMRTELGSPVIKERTPTRVRVRFPAGFRPAERFVHMDITDTSGAIVGSTLLPVAEDHGETVATGTFTSPSWGSMLLTFFALGERTGAKTKELGLMVAGQDLVVQTDRELQVTLHGVPARARPGDMLDVTAEVLDHAGQPADVSVGAAVVDKNILRMSDPLRTTPMDRFYDPLLRTMSTTGSKMLTWPVVSRNWGKTRLHDIALPPFDWTPAGTVESCRSHWDDEDLEAAGAGLGTIGLGNTGLIGKGGGGGSGRLSGRERARITIRTRFPATSLWEPHLRGKGEVSIRGRLPDQMGEQELVVVASDKHGGVGLARKTLEIDQEIYGRAQLPTTTVVGESLSIPVMVHNGTATAGRFDVGAKIGKRRSTASLTVPAHGDASVEVPLRFDRAGHRALRLTTSPHGGTPADIVSRKVRVTPAGVALPDRRSATVSGASPTELTLVVPPGQRSEAHLRVELPAVTTGLLGLDGVLDTIGDDPWSLASDLTTAVLVLELAKRHEVQTPKVQELRASVLAATSMLARVQASNGGFSYWRNGEASPYVTAQVLEGLLEAKRIGLPVHDDVITRASRFLAIHLRKGLPVDAVAIGWWEGSTAAVREGLGAEIFDILTRVPTKLRSKKVQTQLDRRKVHYDRLLENERLDPQTASHALLGSLRMGGIEPTKARAVIGRLLAARDGDHWEPSWFHAYGGRVDATLAVLRAMHEVDPSGFQVDQRDALSWILATRPAWGDWHNDAGTAAALRALALVGAAPEASPATLSITLDGKPLSTLKVDPDDPVGSTLAAQHIDLGGSLGPGTHRVTVDYDGTLEPVATLVTRTWTRGAAAKQKAGGLSLQATAVGTADVGGAVVMFVTAEGKRLGGSTIVVSGSGLLEADLAALARATGRGGAIASVRPNEEGLALTIAPGVDETTVAIPFVAARPGKGRLPAVGLVPATVDETARALVVDPGALEVTK